MPLNDALTERQASVLAGVLLPVVESFEYIGDDGCFFGVDADTIVAGGNDPVSIGVFSADVDLRAGSRYGCDGNG